MLPWMLQRYCWHSLNKCHQKYNPTRPAYHEWPSNTNFRFTAEVANQLQPSPLITIYKFQENLTVMSDHCYKRIAKKGLNSAQNVLSSYKRGSTTTYFRKRSHTRSALFEDRKASAHLQLADGTFIGGNEAPKGLCHALGLLRKNLRRLCNRIVRVVRVTAVGGM